VSVAATRIEVGEKTALDGGSEEALGQVLGVLIVIVELGAEKAINRLPVQRGDTFQGLPGQALRRGLEERDLS